jgi:hypothetical protein
VKTSQSKLSKKENRRRASVKVKKERRAQGLGRSTTTAEEKHIIMKTDTTNQYEDPGLKLSNLFIEDLIDNEDLWLHLGATASIYAESPKGLRKLIDAVLMQMCGITFATIIAAAEQNTTVLKAEVKYDYKHLPNLDVEELRQCLDEV